MSEKPRRRKSDSALVKWSRIFMTVFAGAMLVYSFYALDRNLRSNTDEQVRDAYNRGISAIYWSQLRACERSNDRGEIVKRESDGRIASHAEERAVLRTFLASAAKARRNAYRNQGFETDLKAAQEYESLIRRLDKVRFRKLAIYPTDCNKAIPRPDLLRP